MIIDNEILSEVNDWIRNRATKKQIILKLDSRGYSESEILNILELLQAEQSPFQADFAVVANRSLHNNFVKVSNDETQLYIYKDFLSPDFCSYLCDHIRSRADESSPVSEDCFKSDQNFYVKFTKDLAELDKNITDLFEVFAKLPRRSAETMYGQCTYIGDGSTPRFSFFDSAELLRQGSLEEGGQRTWSIHAFLNEDVIGGDLFFPELKVEIQPKTGLVVLWNNLTIEGKPNKKTLHGEAPVQQGTKFSLSKHYRLYFTP